MVNKLVAMWKKEPILVLGAAGVLAITIYNGVVQGDTGTALVNDVLVALGAFAGRSQVSPTAKVDAPAPPAS